MRHVLRLVLFSLFICLLITGSFIAGFATAQANAPAPGLASVATEQSEDVQQQFGIFWEAWRIVEREFVDRSKIDSNEMTKGAIKGMLESLGDQYTSHLEKRAFEHETNELRGTFSGIGATVSMENRQLTVVSPIEGSPAERAGLRPGTIIVAVDDEETAGMTLTEAVNKIRGPRGTVVRLSVLFPGERGVKTIEITRDEIRNPSVSSRVVPDTEIGYLRISQFTAQTQDEVSEHLDRLQRENIKGLIVDVRSDPGGYLETVVRVTSQFLRDGVILYQVDGSGNRRPFNVRTGGKAVDIPLVVLVNKGSASASEILAGAIQDHNRGVIIGEQTYGKGTVTQFFPLSDGSAVNVAIARWLTPNGHQIEGQGITPDIELIPTEEEIQAGKDPVLERALEYLQSRQ